MARRLRAVARPAPGGLCDLVARALLEFAEADRRFLANALGA